MSTIITDAALAARLSASATPQELLGPDGRMLGRYIPAISNMTFPETGLTDEELHRRLADPNGWVTAEQVKAKLDELRGSNSCIP